MYFSCDIWKTYVTPQRVCQKNYNDEFVCNDDDGDTCDECSSGQYNSASDGADCDGDGACDAGDSDDDNDGSTDDIDEAPITHDDDYDCNHHRRTGCA